MILVGKCTLLCVNMMTRVIGWLGPLLNMTSSYNSTQKCVDSTFKIKNSVRKIDNLENNVKLQIPLQQFSWETSRLGEIKSASGFAELITHLHG